jgi:hypothetical protein
MTQNPRSDPGQSSEPFSDIVSRREQGSGRLPLQVIERKLSDSVEPRRGLNNTGPSAAKEAQQGFEAAKVKPSSSPWQEGKNKGENWPSKL